jgi:hypothetical protein
VAVDLSPTEHFRAPRHQRVDHCGERDRQTFGPQGRHATVGDPTRDDVAEHGEVAVDVEREAVQRAPRAGRAAHGTHADGRYFAWAGALGVDPYARVLLDTRGAGQPQVAQRGDDQLLQSVHMGGPSRRLVRHRQDRVHDHLSGPVVGDVAAPVRLLERGPHRCRIDQDMSAVGVGPQGEDVRMLEHQEVVVVAVLCQRVLQGEGLVIGNGSQVANPKHGSTLDLPRARQPSRDCRSTPTPAPRTRRHTRHRPHGDPN